MFSLLPERRVVVVRNYRAVLFDFSTECYSTEFLFPTFSYEKRIYVLPVFVIEILKFNITNIIVIINIIFVSLETNPYIILSY